jgi:hypothetical protein
MCECVIGAQIDSEVGGGGFSSIKSRTRRPGPVPPLRTGRQAHTPSPRESKRVAARHKRAAAAGMGSESNRGGADRTVGEEETKRGELFEPSRCRRSGSPSSSSTDPSSTPSQVPVLYPQHPLVRISLPASSLCCLCSRSSRMVSCFRFIPNGYRSGSLIAIAPIPDTHKCFFFVLERLSRQLGMQSVTTGHPRSSL